MDNKYRPNLDANTNTETPISDAAADLVNQGKKYANNAYQQGVDKINDVEDTMKEYSEKFVEIIHEKPITSIMIAAGVGMLLASFLKK